MSRITAPYWKPSTPCHPEKQASSGNASPFFLRPVELHHLAARHLQGFLRQFENRERTASPSSSGRADPIERLADHFAGW